MAGAPVPGRAASGPALAQAQASQSRWSRTTLFKTAFWSSVPNLVIPLLIATITKLEYVAIWLGVRAGVQLTVAALPSPIHTLLQSHGGEMEAEELEAARRRAPFYLLLLSLTVFACVLVVPFWSSSGMLPGASTSLPWSLALFAGLMFMSSASVGMLRVVERGDIFFSVAKRELVLSMAIIPLLYLGFSAFLFGAAAKEALKLALVLPAFGRPEMRLPHWRTLLSGRPQYFRGIAQVASQYLERTVYPLLFGLKLAGQLGLGSTLGILPVMFSANMYLWAFRKVAQGDADVLAAIADEWSRLLVMAASLCWWLTAAGAVVELGNYGAIEVAAAASFTATMGVGFLAVARSRESLLSTRSSLLHLAVLSVTYLVIAISAWAGADVVVALLAGIAVNFVYTVALALRMPRVERNKLVVYASVALAAIAAFAAAVPLTGWLWAVVAAAVAAALSAPYLLELYRRARR